MDFAAMIYGMGLAPTLVQRKAVRPDHVATALFCALLMACLAAIAMWFAAPLVAGLLQIPELTQILKVIAWLTPFGAFSVLCEALLARNMKPGRTFSGRRRRTRNIASANRLNVGSWDDALAQWQRRTWRCGSCATFRC